MGVYVETRTSRLWYVKSSSVADPHHVDADSDPAFPSDADPDPTFQYDADPTTPFFPELDPLMLQNYLPRLPPFHFGADPDLDPGFL